MFEKEKTLTKILNIATALASVLIVAAPLRAQSAAYVAGTAGLTFPEDITSSAGIRGRLNDGYALTLAVGTAIGPIRGELEGSYRDSSVRGASGFGLDLPGTGRASALSGMVNAYFDPAFHFGPIKPYVGAGVGVTRFRARSISATGIPFIGPVTDIGPVTASRTGVSYQAMAGFGVALAPHTTATLGYRYFATPGASTDVAQLGRVHVDGLRIHAVEAGLRFAL